MNKNRFYVIGLLVLGMQCAHADTAGYSEDSLVATPNYFFTNPNGGTTTDDEPKGTPPDQQPPQNTPPAQTPNDTNKTPPSTPLPPSDNKKDTPSTPTPARIN